MKQGGGVMERSTWEVGGVGNIRCSRQAHNLDTVEEVLEVGLLALVVPDDVLDTSVGVEGEPGRDGVGVGLGGVGVGGVGVEIGKK